MHAKYSFKITSEYSELMAEFSSSISNSNVIKINMN